MGQTGRELPRLLRSRRHQHRRDVPDQTGVWAGSGKSEPDARGHLDHAGIEFQKPQPGGLDPSAGTALLVPGFCPVVCLGEASQAGFLVECAAGANVVGGFIDTPVEHGVAGQAKDEVDPVLVTPLYDLGAAVMTVVANGDPDLRPMPADATDQAAQVTADLVA